MLRNNTLSHSEERGNLFARVIEFQHTDGAFNVADDLERISGKHTTEDDGKISLLKVQSLNEELEKLLGKDKGITKITGKLQTLNESIGKDKSFLLKEIGTPKKYLSYTKNLMS